ncbi:MAG: FAD-dependent oxidoreductase [Proteobacteria bacterium]|nr:FAD-dependent oxidoreductase [Pseudomonadota bacterium]
MISASKKFPTDPHGWAELLPERQARQSLSGTHRVPWVVVGAGFTGLACARRLGELHPDQEILLLDARLVAQGASGRNSGFAVVTSQFPGGVVPDQIENYRRVNRINRAGLDLLSAQVSEQAIDCQWCEEGIYHTAADRLAIKEYHHFLHYLETLEIDHRPLDKTALHDRLGTSLYQVGIHVTDGALLQPAALVRGLADTLPANVRLYEQSPALKIEDGKPLTLHLATGEVKTDKLILTMNYEASTLGFLRPYIIGSTLSGSFTRVLSKQELASLGSETEWGVISLHGGGATLRLTRDHRLCIRNTAEYHSSTLLSDKKLAHRQAIHRVAFDKRFPQLAQVPFEYSWSGVEGITRNNTNFFGRQRDNIYLAGGYNGSGVSRGTAFGAAIADYASEETSQTISDCLASAPGAWMPPRPFLDIGAFFTVHSRFRGVGLDR